MIEPSEIRLDIVRIDKRGGQHVGSPPTEVKATHIKTGLSATCGTERSQHKNRVVAEQMLEYGLLEIGYIK